MAHFAKVENSTVTSVIVAEQEFIDQLLDRESWVQTSYNTHANVHYSSVMETRYFKTVMHADQSTEVMLADTEIDPATTYVLGTSSYTNYYPDGGIALRGNFAEIGDTYDSVHDVFYPPRPFPSWIISSSTNWTWTTPIPSRTDLHGVWHEPSRSWLYPIPEDDDLRDFVTWVETFVVDPTSMRSFLLNPKFNTVPNLLSLAAHSGKGASTSTIYQYIFSNLLSSTYTEVVSYVTDIMANTGTFTALMESIQNEINSVTTSTQVDVQ